MARRNAHFRRRFNASGPLERVLILIVLAAAIGVTIGLALAIVIHNQDLKMAASDQ